jgi:2-phosphoglycolate phosphatase
MHFNNKPIKAVLFDLDGTLLDTATDLGHALNHLLVKRDKEPLAYPIIRPAAGRGCRGLLKLGLNVDENHPDFTALCTELHIHYYKHLADTTTFFPGMDTVLLQLEQANIPWGIVTNKPARFTLKLLASLQLLDRATCIVSGDTLKKSKPHPEPILHACELLQQNPSECLYVGDSEIDIIASRAAGSPSFVAMYGYIPAEETPHTWNANGYIQQPLELFELLSF